MTYVCWFHEDTALINEMVGGKTVNLSHLSSAGFPVPPGFCITAAAYRYVVEVTGLAQVIERLLQVIDFTDPASVTSQASRIRQAILQQPVPTAMAEEILDSYRELALQMNVEDGQFLSVAIRSSATAEDLPGASFAGQQDTYLNIRGDTAVLDHIRRCWASLWTDRAITYRHRQGFDHNKVFLAVIVQAMIEADSSGVLFTANPVTSCLHECIINASWGLGEAVVSGSVTPDTFIVNKNSGEILQRQIASKEVMTDYDLEGSSREKKTSPYQRLSPALSDHQVSYLTALGARIENSFGTPQDIEWAFFADRWYVLQSRPITTLEATHQEEQIEGRYSRAMFVEIFADGLSPAFLSVVCPLLADMLDFTFKRLGFAPPEQGEAVRVFRNQPYLSIDYIETTLAALEPEEHERLVSRFVNVFENESSGGRLTVNQLRMALGMLVFLRQFHRNLPGMLRAYQAMIERVTEMPVEEASATEILLAVREVAFQGAGPLLNNDFLLIASIGTLTQLIVRLLRPAYGPQADAVANNLISAVKGNVVMETNGLIWDLAQTVAADSFLARTIRESEPGELLLTLQQMPEGQAFLSRLSEVLEICGHREVHLDILYPTWGEDPTPVLTFIRGYLETDRQHSPRERERQLATQRQLLEVSVLNRISRDPAGLLLRRPLLSWLVEQTRQLARERDTMHFEWTRIFPPVRRLELELGRRWVDQQLLDQPDDIFFLTLDEQDQTAQHPQPCHGLIAQRRQALAANLSGPWPLVIGDTSTPIVQAKSANGSPTYIEGGIGGSPGLVTGPARIIMGPEDFGKLRAGDILVAPLTNPVWTPLFAMAVGIVTEVGGILSHGAIVAREYGIPAVMSVPGITTRLSDGQIVTIDGNRGLVQMAPSSMQKDD